MSFEVHGMQWLAGTLRAWHLAMLRYAVTLDNADRLAVLRIAHEIDGLTPRHDGRTAFEFFRRTSAELCAAIQQPNERSHAILQQYLVGLSDDRLKRALAAAIATGQQSTVSPIHRIARQRNELWRGLSPRSNL